VGPREKVPRTVDEDVDAAALAQGVTTGELRPDLDIDDALDVI
jgi:hypothetical protein